MLSFTIFTVAILAVVVAYVYLFGIPAQLKRRMEEKALETIGENKASYMLKDQINKLPASEQKDVKHLQDGVGTILGGALQTPLGKEAGELGDTLTGPFTGR